MLKNCRHAVREEGVGRVRGGEGLGVRAADDVHAVLHVREIQIHVERVPFDARPVFRRRSRDRSDAAFADAVVNVPKEEMDVLVRVDVPIPADEICERLEAFDGC